MNYKLLLKTILLSFFLSIIFSFSLYADELEDIPHKVILKPEGHGQIFFMEGHEGDLFSEYEDVKIGVIPDDGYVVRDFIVKTTRGDQLPRSVKKENEEYWFDMPPFDVKVTVIFMEGSDKEQQDEDLAKGTNVLSCDINEIGKAKLISSVPYTGREVNFSINLYAYDDKGVRYKLAQDNDYKVEIKNNINAGTCYVKIQGMGPFSNYSTTKTVQIEQISLSGNDDIEIPKLTYFADARPGKPSKKVKIRPIVIWRGMLLSYGKDYTCDKECLTESGTIKITGVRNFRGEVTTKVELVAPNDPDDPNASYPIRNTNAKLDVVKYNYTGIPVRPVPSLTLKGYKFPLEMGKDYSVRYYSNAEVGRHAVLITGKGAFSGSIALPYEVVASNIRKDSEVQLYVNIGDGQKMYIDNRNGITATGVAIEPSTEVSKLGKPLIKGEDYVVTYKKNRLAGGAVAEIKGINGFSGVIKQKFKIIPKK